MGRVGFVSGGNCHGLDLSYRTNLRKGDCVHRRTFFSILQCGADGAAARAYLGSGLLFAFHGNRVNGLALLESNLPCRLSNHRYLGGFRNAKSLLSWDFLEKDQSQPPNLVGSAGGESLVAASSPTA